MVDRLPVRDALLSFAPQEPLQAALFLTYAFDGRWFEEALIPDLCERPITTILVVRDGRAISTEAPSARYRKANASKSAVFHPKLALLVAEDRVRAVISSANLTRGGFERQRELGRVFDLGPSDTANRAFFLSLHAYLERGVGKEVRGDSARDLGRITEALKSVLGRHDPSTVATSNVLLHNYAEPIWDQVLAKMPHRVLRRAVVVSPFYEPDRTQPEDPALGPDDGSVFARLLLKDLTFEPPRGEPPVRVFFRQSEGRTELPVTKLRGLEQTVALYAQDEREPRLHAKLLLLEGAEGAGRKPFLLAVYGSPNFTTAGLLGSPPHGNAELAVLSILPAGKKRMAESMQLLQMEQGFTLVQDWDGLTAMERDQAHPTSPALGLADATYRVAAQAVSVTLAEAPPDGSSIRVLVERDGHWIVVGEVAATGTTEVEIPVHGIAEVGSRTAMLELRATRLRIDVLAGDGRVVSSDIVPLNVDVPDQFCGQTLVGSALLSLDERIARAGLGRPLSYREQQARLEARKSDGADGDGPTLTRHHADLDRFFRNIHQGLRGVLARATGDATSLFATRRALDELSRWALEATESAKVELTLECRLYLIERVVQAMTQVLESCAPSGLGTLLGPDDSHRVSERLARVCAWLEQSSSPTLGAYLTNTRTSAKNLVAVLWRGSAQ